MLSVYVFALVLGAGFLGVSLFGDALDTDLGDFDVDADLDVDGTADLGGDAGGLSKILSLRSLIYGVFGFGAVGTGLHLIWDGTRGGSTLMYAIAGGIVSGALISVLFSFIQRTESGARPSEERYSGLTGSVSLPIQAETGGQIIVRQSDRTFRLPARVHPGAIEAGPSEEWTEVVVVAMENGVALVTPTEPDLLGPADPDEEA